MKDQVPLSTDSATSSVDQRILDIFRGRKGGIVSGEELSGALSLSRTAIWKHIKSLRALGYDIAAVPSQGYRLLSAPDLLLPPEIGAGLGTVRIGRRLISFRETDSTNRVAFKLAEEGADEGTVVIAEAQTGGKGRMGRRWESPGGVNLYCSVILRPPILPMQAAQLTLCSAVAVARALEGAASVTPAIKWPNDVLLNGRKVAGLLNELSAETEKVNFVILGTGININMSQDQFPADLRHPATSLLLETGSPVSRLAVARSYFQALDELYDTFLTRGYAPVREEWLSRCNVMGRRVRVSLGDRELTATVMGVDEYGALLVRGDDGRDETILSGDVALL